MRKIKAWAKKLKRQIFVLHISYQDKRVPWYAKLITACVVAYAFSPIDLIPDFIPVLGYLDDVIIVPLGIMLALKLIPDEVIEDCETIAEKKVKSDKPKNWIAGALIVLLWIAVFLWIFGEINQLVS